MFETVLSIGIVLFAAFYMARYMYRVLQGKTSCHCAARPSGCTPNRACTQSAIASDTATRRHPQQSLHAPSRM